MMESPDLTEMEKTQIQKGLNRGYLAALAATGFNTFTPIFIRILTENYQMPALVLAYWREVFVTVTLVIFLSIFKPGLLKGTRQHLPFLLAFGLFMAFYNAIYTLSVALNGAAVATALVHMSAVFTALLGWLFLKEEITTIKIVAIAVSVAGCMLVMKLYEPQNWSVNALGFLTGILSGLLYAIYSLLGRSSAQRGISPWTSLMATFGFASVFMLALNLGFGSVLPGGASTPQSMFWLGNAWQGWAILFVLAAGPTLIGYGLYNVSLSHLPASVANLIVIITPVFATIMAYFVLGETVNSIQIVGGLMIIAGLVLVRFRLSRPAARKAA